MNGYKTEIFELHNKVGGLCSSWKRGEYSIDGCIHWWVAGNPQDPLYPIFDALVDMKNYPRIAYEEFCSIEADGEILHFYSDLDRFEAELKAVSPEDSEIIEEMIAGARSLLSLKMSADKDLAATKIIGKWKMSIGEYSKKFKSPLIRKLLAAFPFTEEYSMIVFLSLDFVHF